MVAAGLRLSDARSLVVDLTEGEPDTLPVDEEIEDFLLGRLSGVSSETIFIPTEVPVDAGMKSVVIPCFLITVRCGW